MENKDWREEFDKKCKKFEFDGAYETDVDLKLVKPFIESILKSKQEEIEGAMGEMKRKELSSIDVGPVDIPDIETQGYNKALDDLKPIISNLLK